MYSHLKMSNNIIIKQEQENPGLIMITKGKIQLYCDQLKFKNEFTKDMILA